MAIGLIGRKCGMTRIFTEDGNSVPVTVIEVDANRVSQIKNSENDGYTAVQVAFGNKRSSLVNKPLAGHLAKAQAGASRGMMEFRVSEGELASFELGASLTADRFEDGQLVDVTGVTKGKGFQGTIKRYNFAMGDATHGNSLAHRAPGSIGQRQTPGRVFKGKKMAGHMGSVRQTTQNLRVVRVDVERGVLLVSGAVPGATGTDVVVRPAAKA